MLNRFLLALACLAVFGCKTVDTKDISCSENWHDLGVATAEAGKSVRTFNQYMEACGDSLGDSAKDAYLDGYTIGIVNYCTSENGFKMGSHNEENPKVCPAELQDKFNKAYTLGLIDYRDKVSEMKRKSRYNESTLENAESSTMQPKTSSGH